MIKALTLLLIVAVTASASDDRVWLSRHREAQKTGVCERHHVAMKRKVVTVEFGDPYDDNEYNAAMIRDFPNASEEVNGGCTPDGPGKASIYVCPACKRAQHQWAITHRTNGKAKWILQHPKA